MGPSSSLTLNSSTTNTYSGGTLVETNAFLDVQAVGQLGTGNVSVNDGGTLELDTTTPSGLGCIASNADLLLTGAAPTVNLQYLAPTSFTAFLQWWRHLSTGRHLRLQQLDRNLPKRRVQCRRVGRSFGHRHAFGQRDHFRRHSDKPGSSVTFTSTVTGGGATPTGTVTFYDGASAIGTSALSGGVATITVSDFQATSSPHSITAVYSGDVNYDKSTAAAVSQTVSPLPVTLPIPIVVSNMVYNATNIASLAPNQVPVGCLPGDSNYVRLDNALITATFWRRLWPMARPSPSRTLP